MIYDANFVVLLILLVNTAAAVIYMLIMYSKTRYAHVIQRGMIMLVCPVVGVLSYFFSFLFNAWKRKDDVDYDYLSFDKTRKRFLQPVDKNREMETLPLEEVLSVSNTKDRRSAMLNMIRRDSKDTLSLARKATGNDDSETSHYAATALMDKLGRFDNELSDLQIAYDKDRTNLQANQELLDAVLRILNSGGLLKVDEDRYRYLLIRLVQNLDANHPEAITPEYYAALVRACYEVGHVKEAEQWATISLERQPDSEESYLNVMYIKYLLGKGDDFNAALDQLTNSSIALSDKGLRIVRFWLKK